MARRKELAPLIPWAYDLILWSFSLLLDLFFREVHPRGSWKIPKRGPVIFVAAPHANQFVDPLLLMRVVYLEAHRRISNLIAGKSMRRRFVGRCARAAGAIPVERALDLMKPGSGTIYLPDPENDPTFVRGIGTKFDSSEVQVGGLLVLPSVKGSAANAEILEVHGPEEIKLKKSFKGSAALEQLTGRSDIDGNGNFIDGDTEGRKGAAEGFQGTRYKTAPKVDQAKVYDAVFERLNAGGCCGMFPEGGSHDRTELLPLKAGVAIMALGALAANPDSDLKIVPCGMNYFHAHKFRSRAVIEFGNPVEVPSELVEMYKRGERRESVGQLLDIIYQALVSVTVTSPDYDTLMLIQAVRRLYNPTGKKLPLPMVVELNRRLVKGYTQYKDDPRILNLKKSVLDYNKQLWLLGIRDHQVELGKLAIMATGTLPGLVLFAPVFVATKMISIKKSREALAASTVKIQGRDVMATWKLLVALAFAPILYVSYTIVLTWWTYRNRVNGYIPEWVPLWVVVLSSMIFFPSITFAALRFGETGMDIVKSMRPLVLSLIPSSSNTIYKLREKRTELSAQVTEVINTFGPEMFDDFDSTRIIANPFKESGTPATPSHHEPLDEADSPESFRPTSPKRANTAGASTGGSSTAQGHLPRNESFGNLGNIGIFATRPPSRSRSRSGSNSGTGRPGAMKGFSALNSKAGFDEVSKKIRGAMKERGKERTRRRSEEGWDLTGSGTETPMSEEGKKEI